MSKANRLLYRIFYICLGLCVLLSLVAIWAEDWNPLVAKLIGSSLVGFFAAAFALAVSANCKRLQVAERSSEEPSTSQKQ
ncbi:MAG: hypothetical protein ACKO2G_16050 [Verrucomicrobiales bacterium]